MMSTLRNSTLMALMLAASLPGFAQEMRQGYPTIFHNPIIKIAASSCAVADKVTLLSEEGKVFANLCPLDYRLCLFEGSCTIESANGKQENFSYVTFSETLRRRVFEKSSDRGCTYGIGRGYDTKREKVVACLDPYFSVGASGTDHAIGQVIFVPKLVGEKMPTGEIHDGYLVIRDENPDLTDAGEDRFAFFSGYQNDMDLKNPLVRLMFDNIDYTFDYQNVSEEKAQQVRAARNYPGLPVLKAVAK